MALNQAQQRLWTRLQTFPLDRASHPAPFTQRLRLEHGWSRGFADRVIYEY